MLCRLEDSKSGKRWWQWKWKNGSDRLLELRWLSLQLKKSQKCEIQSTAYLRFILLRNICSLRLERSCSEMEKLEGEVSFPRENFHFPRSDSCLTERSEVRQSRSRKRKVLSRKRKSLRVFSSQSSTSFQPQGCIFYASNASWPQP